MIAYVITEEQLRELARAQETLGRVLASAIVVAGPEPEIERITNESGSCLRDRERLRLSGRTER